LGIELEPELAIVEALKSDPQLGCRQEFAPNLALTSLPMPQRGFLRPVVRFASISWRLIDQDSGLCRPSLSVRPISSEL